MFSPPPLDVGASPLNLLVHNIARNLAYILGNSHLPHRDRCNPRKDRLDHQEIQLIPHRSWPGYGRRWIVFALGMAPLHNSSRYYRLKTSGTSRLSQNRYMGILCSCVLLSLRRAYPAPLFCHRAGDARECFTSEFCPIRARR